MDTSTNVFSCLLVKMVKNGNVMNGKAIRRSLYKVLRKTGVPKERINEEASLRDELFLGDLEMNCFLFYLETRFNLAIKNEELSQLNSVKSTIDFLHKHCA